MVGVNDAPRSQILIRPTGALESLDAERRRFNDRLLLLLRLRRPLVERARRRRSGEPALPTADPPLRSQFADPVLPLPASSGIRARVPSRTSYPVFRARAADSGAERRSPLVEPERSIPFRRALLIVLPEPRPRRCCSREPGQHRLRPHPPMFSAASAVFFAKLCLSILPPRRRPPPPAFCARAAPAASNDPSSASPLPVI
jgi:hypothetical protein